MKNGVRTLRSLLFLLGVLGLMAMVALAQTETGQITGTVRDASGALVVGAKVIVKSINTGLTREAETNSVGSYTVASLRPDTYDVTIQYSGFKKYSRRVEVIVGSNNEVSAQMEVGESAVTVEVAGVSEGVQVNTETSTLSQVVSSKQMTELPTLTRNPYDLVATSGNVAEDATSGRGAGFAVNGQRSASTSILLDGGENVDLFTATVGQQVPLDSVQELSVLTNNFGAEYGRASGGVVNVVTKSGTNAFHGSVYEFNRVSKLSSNTYNNDANGVPKAPFTRNQFGYSIGGPVIKDKLFFFNNTEWIRIRSNGTQFFEVTDPSFLALPQVNSATTSFFNAYGKFRPGLNVVSTIPWSTASTSCAFGISCSQPFADIVSYNVPSDAGGGSPQNTYETVARVDYNFTDRTSLFVRYALTNQSFLPGVINNSPYAGYDTSESDRFQNTAVNVTHDFTPTFVSTTKVIYNRLRQIQPLGTAPLTPGLFLDSAVPALPGTNYQYVMPGYVQTSTANALPFGGPQNLYQFYEDVSWSKGKHQLKFGGNYIHIRDNRVFGAYENAVQILGSDFNDGINNLVQGQTYQFEGAIDPQGAYPCSKDATGAYIVTPACTINLPVNEPYFTRHFHYNDFALYGQDSWKITPNFTLNLGARWEYYGVQHNDNTKLDSSFYLGQGSNIYEQIRNGSVQLTHNSSVGGFWNPNYHDVGPRVGFAWDPFGNAKTSVRGGYGLSYERNFGNVTYNVIQNPPNYAVISIYGEGVDVATQPIYTDNSGAFTGTGSKPLPNVTLRAPNQNIKTSYAENWSLTVDHQVTKGAVASVEYVGSNGVHLYDIGNINTSYFGSTYLGDARASNRLNYQYGNINYRGDRAFSRYNGLNVSFKSTNLANKGLTLTANYTYSHSLDNLSSTFSDGYWGNYFLGYTDYFHPNLDKGNSDFDLRQRVVIAAVWDLPWMKNASNAVERHVLGGWEISGLFTAHTGYPFTIFDCDNGITICPRWSPAGAAYPTTGSNVTAVGANTFNYMQLPTAGGTVVGLADSLQVPNQSLFCATVAGGDPFTCSGVPMIGRNPFRGPGYWNLNTVFAKNFKLTERVNMQFRGELYNLFNHHNMYINTNTLDVSGGGTTIQSGKGGFGSATDERRNVQFALKLTF